MRIDRRVPGAPPLPHRLYQLHLPFVFLHDLPRDRLYLPIQSLPIATPPMRHFAGFSHSSHSSAHDIHPLRWDILPCAGWVYTMPRRPYVYFFRSTSTHTRLHHFHLLHPPLIPFHCPFLLLILSTSSSPSLSHIFYYFLLFLVLIFP